MLKVESSPHRSGSSCEIVGSKFRVEKSLGCERALEIWVPAHGSRPEVALKEDLTNCLPQDGPDPGDEVPADRVEEQLADVDDDHLENSAAAGKVVIHSVGTNETESSFLGIWTN